MTARSKLTPTTRMLWLEAPKPTSSIISLGGATLGPTYEARVLGQANRAIALDHDNVRAYMIKSGYLGLSRRFSEALGVTDAGLAVNPNFAPLYIPRAVAENSLGRYEQAKADAERAMRLSPRDPGFGTFHLILGDAEISLGHYDAAIEEYRKALDSGLRQFMVHTNLAAAYVHANSEAIRPGIPI